MSQEYTLYDRDDPMLSNWERELYGAVSRDEPWGLLEEFSELRRLSPSDDEKESASVLEGRFDEYGVPYERYDPEFWLSVLRNASIRAADEQFSGSEENWLDERPAVKALAFSGSGTVTGEVVHIELPETESSEEALEQASFDAEGMDLEGKIVLIDKMIAAKQFFQVRRGGRSRRADLDSSSPRGATDHNDYAHLGSDPCPRSAEHNSGDGERHCFQNGRRPTS